MKDYFSKDFKSLLSGLLEKNPRRRLTLKQCKSHPFFKKIDLDQVLKRSIKAPINPKVTAEHDLKNVDKKVLQQDLLEGSPRAANAPVNRAESLRKMQDEYFNDMTYCEPSVSYTLDEIAARSD